MYTLVVVDMQSYFKTTGEPSVIKACQREIKLAIRRKAGIIFLEFGSFGDTMAELKDLVTGYDKAYFAVKNRNDGSAQVYSLITRHNLYHNVRVTGVNTSYCVYETVVGLTSYHGSVTVVADACNCHNHSFGLKKLSELKIKIINRYRTEQIKIDTPASSWYS